MVPATVGTVTTKTPTASMWRGSRPSAWAAGRQQPGQLAWPGPGGDALFVRPARRRSGCARRSIAGRARQFGGVDRATACAEVQQWEAWSVAPKPDPCWDTHVERLLADLPHPHYRDARPMPTWRQARMRELWGYGEWVPARPIAMGGQLDQAKLRGLMTMGSFRSPFAASTFSRPWLSTSRSPSPRLGVESAALI